MCIRDRIEAASKSNSTVTGIPTGFIDLDYRTSGFQPSDFILIAARPSMGKTAFVLNVVEHVAVKKGLPCMVFSLEMSKEQLVNRMPVSYTHLCFIGNSLLHKKALMFQ